MVPDLDLCDLFCIWTTKLLFFFREFQLIALAPDDSFLSLDQDTNWFLV